MKRISIYSAHVYFAILLFCYFAILHAHFHVHLQRTDSNNIRSVTYLDTRGINIEQLVHRSGGCHH